VADVVTVLLRQHIVALMRPIAFAAAQLNVALRDGAVSPIPEVPRFDLGVGAAAGVATPAEHAERFTGAPADDWDDVVDREVVGRAAPFA
jgi:hypothetical protein